MVKNPPASTEDVGSVLGSGRSPGEGNGNPLQYSCLGNPMERGAWPHTVCGVTKSAQLSACARTRTHTHTLTKILNFKARLPDDEMQEKIITIPTFASSYVRRIQSSFFVRNSSWDESSHFKKQIRLEEK